MKKEELQSELKKLPIIRIIGILQILSLLTIISSPFVLVWYDGYLAFKIGISGLIGVFIMYGIDWIFKQAIKQVVDEYKEPETTKKSKF